MMSPEFLFLRQIAIRSAGFYCRQDSIERLAQELQALTYTGRSPGRGSGAKVVSVFDYADPLFHRRRAFQTVPPDGLFQWQWYLHNDGSDGGVVGADIAPAQAWDYTPGDPAVKIAVNDDGF